MSPESTYKERQRAVTVPADIVRDLWKEIKNARDMAFQRKNDARIDLERLEAMLDRMETCGMSDHLPTIEEVRAAWRGD